MFVHVCALNVWLYVIQHNYGFQTEQIFNVSENSEPLTWRDLKLLFVFCGTISWFFNRLLKIIPLLNVLSFYQNIQAQQNKFKMDGGN